MKREEYRSRVTNITTLNLRNSDKYLTEIFKIVIDMINSYNDRTTLSSWKVYRDEIIDLMYESLTETYSNTINEWNNIYTDTKDFDIEDIKNLTYMADGKTLKDRIDAYINTAYARLKDEESKTTVKQSTEFFMERLLNNETRYIETSVKKNKIPLNADIIVIDGECSCGDGECEEYAGEYPADEDIDLPPFHPGCTCNWWYEKTDDESEIANLDLEIEP